MYLSIQRYIPPERSPDNFFSSKRPSRPVLAVPFCAVRMGEDDGGEDHLADLEVVERQLDFGVDIDEVKFKTCEDLKSDEVGFGHSRYRFSSLETKSNITERKNDKENQQPAGSSIEAPVKQVLRGFSTFLSTHSSLLGDSFSLKNVNMIEDIDQKKEGKRENEKLDRSFDTYLRPQQPESVLGHDGNMNEFETDMKGNEVKGNGYDDSGYASISFDNSSNSSYDSNCSLSSPSPLLSTARAFSSSSSSSSSSPFSIVLLIPETEEDISSEPIVRPKPRSSEFLRHVLQQEHLRAQPDTLHQWHTSASLRPSVPVSSLVVNDNKDGTSETVDESAKNTSMIPSHPSEPISITSLPDLDPKSLPTPADSSYLDKSWLQFDQTLHPRKTLERRILPLPARTIPGQWFNPRPFRKEHQTGGSYGSWLGLGPTDGMQKSMKKRGGYEPEGDVKLRQPKADHHRRVSSTFKAPRLYLEGGTNPNVDMDADVDMKAIVELSKIKTTHEGDPLMFATLNISGEKSPWSWEH